MASYVLSCCSTLDLTNEQLQQRNISYVVDVKANAKGFEYLGKLSLQKKQREG